MFRFLAAAMCFCLVWRATCAAELSWLFADVAEETQTAEVKSHVMLPSVSRQNARDLSIPIPPKETVKPSANNTDQISEDSLSDIYSDVVMCNNDRVCNRKLQYCDQHYGLCKERVPIGHQCRRDEMCRRGTICMFGHCQAKVKKGEEGARCRKSRDCGSGMCCARKHGHQICQKNLQLGAKCYVPEGGLDYYLNEQCPCDDGLMCIALLANSDDTSTSALARGQRCTARPKVINLVPLPATRRK